MTDLHRRIVLLETRRKARRPADNAAHERHAARMSDLASFIDATWRGRSESLAHYTAMIFGLPNSRALREVMNGETAEAVAERHYGVAWAAEMWNTAAEAAEACERAHGPDWQEHFDTIWRG